MTLLRILLLLAALGTVSTCSDDPKTKSKQEDSLKVGLLAPKTGVMAGHGESMEMGLRVAEVALNEKGGVLGKKIEVVVLDTQSDPGTAAQRTNELIEKNKVKLIVGTGLSSETLATIPISTRAKVPFIYSMDGELKTCSVGNPNVVSQYVWGAGFTERMIVKPFLSYLAKDVIKKSKGVKVYLLGGDYVYPRSTNQFARQVAEQMGFAVVGEEYADVGTSDYTPVIRRIAKSGATLLLVTNPGSAAAVFMRQAKQLQLDKQTVISGFATFAQEAVGEMGDASEGAIYANRYTDLLDSEENKAFVAAFRRLYPDKPLLPGPSVAAGGYGAMMVAAAAFTKAGSLDADAFSKSMQGLAADLPQGKVIVDPSNNIFQQHMYLLKVEKQKYKVISDLGLQVHPGLDGCSVK
jgi:ABC-type branched-subunit amino acid transport system substrate-binding protein